MACLRDHQATRTQATMWHTRRACTQPRGGKRCAALAEKELHDDCGHLAMRRTSVMTVVVLLRANALSHVNDPAPVLLALTK